jgi:UDP-N-acetylglucosamine--N-acetylmuramyl-(pentapeptide) pyrophosphoryl-undecaprenol N-acetylglucosamine transferase
MKENLKEKTKFLITGGHLTPALAVIEELKARGFNDLVFVGRGKTMSGDKSLSAEYRVIYDDLRIPFENITTGKIVRFNDLKTLVEFVVNIIKIPVGFIQAFIILLRHKPKVIISFGGYIAVPIVIVGKIFRIPSVTHEQTVVLGLANKIVSKFVDKVLISWKESRKYFNKSKTIFTGNPVRKDVLTSVTNIYRLNTKLKTIYITGGNQGSHTINKNVEPILEKVLDKYNVIHQTGITTITNDFEKFERLSKTLTGRTKGTYIVKGNIYGAEIGEVFEKADLVVSRCGANTLTEILALGKLAILIPIPWSINNEQVKNAIMLEEVGLGSIIEEKDLTSEVLLESINSAFENMSRKKAFKGKVLSKTIVNARKYIKLDAAKRIVDELITIADR